MDVFVSVGTRPEAIKLAPVISALQHQRGTATTVCLTGQHPDLAREALSEFGLAADIELSVRQGKMPLSERFGELVSGIGKELERKTYDWVVVHGDTMSTFAGALAAFHTQSEVAHVEAGLRTGDMLSPWPEEGYRRLVAVTAKQHFAPTQRARANLLREGVAADRISITGNTVVDALKMIQTRIQEDPRESRELAEWLHGLSDGRPVVLLTTHRRENHGDAMRQIALAVSDLAEMRPDYKFICPVHPHPTVRETIGGILDGKENVALCEPLGYRRFIYLMMNARLILSDSGGIQEEAPTFGAPVLVLREDSERPEAIEAGVASLVGTDRRKIVTEAQKRLSVSASKEDGEAPNPFGDGKSAARIASALKHGTRDAFIPHSVVNRAQRSRRGLGSLVAGLSQRQSAIQVQRPTMWRP